MKYADLETAFFYANTGSDLFNNRAFICKKTGETLFDADEMDTGEPRLPESIYDNDDYIQIPDKRDLGLGTRLVWEFVRKAIPALEPKVREIFSKRGAYARYKDFLEYNEILEEWYDFENQRIKEVLLEWCAEHGIQVEDAD